MRHVASACSFIAVGNLIVKKLAKYIKNIEKRNIPEAQDTSASRAPALVSQPSSPLSSSSSLFSYLLLLLLLCVHCLLFVMVFSVVVVVEFVVVVDKARDVSHCDISSVLNVT